MAEHLIYSSDFDPSDYYLFSNLKTFLVGKLFTSNGEAIASANWYFTDLQGLLLMGISVNNYCNYHYIEALLSNYALMSR